MSLLGALPRIRDDGVFFGENGGQIESWLDVGAVYSPIGRLCLLALMLDLEERSLTTLWLEDASVTLLPAHQRTRLESLARHDLSRIDCLKEGPLAYTSLAQRGFLLGNVLSNKGDQWADVGRVLVQATRLRNWLVHPRSPVAGDFPLAASQLAQFVSQVLSSLERLTSHNSYHKKNEALHHPWGL